MKKSLILSIAIVLAFFFTSNSLWAGQNDFDNNPNIHFVITEKRLWVVGDEFPVQNLEVKISDAAGKVVLEKVFTSKTESWFLDLTNLPAGKYKVSGGDLETEWEKKLGLPINQ